VARLAARLPPGLQLTGCLLVAALCVAGCDGGNDSSGDNGGNSGPVQIRGGERLGWRQTSESLQALRLLTFRLYVGENSVTLAETRCGDSLVSGAYECSGRLPNLPPGRYDLQLTAISGGGESARSSPLTVIVGTGSSTDVTSDTAPPNEPSRTASAACVAGVAAGDCYDVSPVVTGLRDVEWLAPADSQLVFFVEGRARVRVIRDDVLVDWPALESPLDSQIVGLAIDGDFAHTRHVFVAFAVPGPDNAPSLTVTRYRELEGVLGEAAPLVTGLAVTPGAPAPLAVDRRGFLYVSQPSSVLRFTTEGFVPRTNLNGSPVVAITPVDSVTGLSVDPSTGRVWIVSNGTEWPRSVATIPRTVEQDGKWPARPAPPERMLGWGSTIRAAAIGFAVPPSGDGSWLLVSTGTDLMRGVPATAGITQMQPVLFDTKTIVRAAAGGSNRSWYVLADEERAGLAVWKLTRR
jgi:hypothetical protein